MINSHSPRIVVAGSSGRLGGTLVNRLRRRYPVTGLGRQDLDFRTPEAISTTLAGLDYDHLIITGALTGVDYCETHQDESFAVNAVAPGIIAGISAGKGAHVTYISSDMVFDGLKTSPYLETDAPNPISVYGASKLAGEMRVLEASRKNLVVRVSWVFGPTRPAFPEWVIGQACSKAHLTLPGDKIACPTYTVDLAEWLEALLFRHPGRPACGTIHLCNSRPCTWRNWGQACIDAAHDAGHPLLAREISGVPLDSVAAFVARRPVHSALDTSEFTRLTGISPRPWEDAVCEHVSNRIPLPQLI
jgi:dTDP-4-dehydrorhamnose reductase